MSGNKIVATVLSSIVFLACFVGFGNNRFGFKPEEGLFAGAFFGGSIWIIYLIVEWIKKRKERKANK